MALAKAAEMAKAKGVPLYTIGLGDPQPERDLELTDLQVDEVVFVDDQVPFRVQARRPGLRRTRRSRSASRSLPAGSQDPAAAKEIASRREEVPPDGASRRRSRSATAPSRSAT